MIMSKCKFVQSLITAVTANGAATIIDHIKLAFSIKQAFILYTL